MSAFPSPTTKGSQPPATTTLRAFLDARAAGGHGLSLAEATAILVPVCLDLKERHARGERLCVHPSAIFNGPSGLAQIHPALAVNPSHVRDRACLAPELLRSNAPGNARASVFAVGAILYEAVCGRPVGPGMPRPRDVDPRLPEALEHLLAKALVADASRRPEDLGALATALHALSPGRSIPPPPSDPTQLDRNHDFEVDISLSLLPPPPTSRAEIRSAVVGDLGVPIPLTQDPTRKLSSLKARLEADPRPRFVASKDGIDHGPFSALELLQQIASYTFTGEHVVRDDLSGVSKRIDEWEEFAPFAEQGHIQRELANEKTQLAKLDQADRKKGTAKLVVGAVVAVALAAAGGVFVLKKVGERKDESDVTTEPSAIDLSQGGALRGGKKAPPTPKSAGAAVNVPSGMSYEAALSSNTDEVAIGGPAGAADLTDAQLSGPMSNAAFIGGCGAPATMKVTVKVAVKMGRAVGVTVLSNPPSPSVSACVDRHVRGLSWPYSAKLDSFTTVY